MGMFTSITHPVDGRELQIKCGNDSCNTYGVGEEVGQYPLPNYAGEGYLLDGIYDSYSNLGDDDYVIIKDGIVAGVEPREATLDAVIAKRAASDPNCTPEDYTWRDVHGFLKAKWKVEDPPRSLWKEEVWARREKAEREVQEDWDQFHETIKDKSPEEQAKLSLFRLITKTVGRRMNYSEIARKCFTVEPLPPSAVAYYDKDPEVTSMVIPMTVDRGPAWTHTLPTMSNEDKERIVEEGIKQIKARNVSMGASVPHKTCPLCAFTDNSDEKCGHK